MPKVLHSPPGSLRPHAGVTLLELLAVMTILAMMAGFSISALQRVGSGTAVQGAERVARMALQRARVSAMREKASTEVMFIPGDRPVARLVEAREVMTMSFDGQSGTKVLAGANNFGRLQGGSLVDGGTVRQCAAVQGRGLILDAVPAYEPTLGFSLEFDLRPGSEGSNGPLAHFGKVFMVDIDDTGGLSATFATEGTGQSLDLKTKPGVLARGVWSRVAISYDGREAILRVQGAVEARKASPDFEQAGYIPLTRPTDTERLTFGGKGFAGHLDEVRYRTLREGDALQLSNLVEFNFTEPLRVRFAPNGRLDRGFHQEAVVIELVQDADTRSIGIDLAGVIR